MPYFSECPACHTSAHADARSCPCCGHLLRRRGSESSRLERVLLGLAILSAIAAILFLEDLFVTHPALMPPAAPAASPGNSVWYEITDVGDLEVPEPPEVRLSRVTGLNNCGQVIGCMNVPSGLNDRGQVVRYVEKSFLWDRGKVEYLPPELCAEAINDAGQVVGRFPEGAFLWQSGRNPVLWRDPPGQYLELTGINDRGQIAGYREPKDPESPRGHSFLWDHGKEYILPHGPYVEPDGLNNLGQIVGHVWEPGHVASPDRICRGFVWSVRGGMRDLGSLPQRDGEYNQTFAESISDRGQVVGYCYHHPFTWENGQLGQLGSLPGYPVEYPTAVNNAGLVVGTALTENDSRQVAVLWKDGAAIDLNSVIPPESGWELGTASKINNQGQIVGVGSLNGHNHGFLLTPLRRPQQPLQQSREPQQLRTPNLRATSAAPAKLLVVLFAFAIVGMTCAAYRYCRGRLVDNRTRVWPGRH